MSGRISLSRRTAEALLGSYPGDWVGTASVVGRAFKELRAALRPRAKKVAAKKARVARKTAKRLTKNSETSAIYEAVAKRADGVCECGCGLALVGFNVPEMDHFWGKARARESVANCWMLTRMCHRMKHAGSPSPEEWSRLFIEHADRHGYTAEADRAIARLASLQLQGRAEAAP